MLKTIVTACAVITISVFIFVIFILIIGQIQEMIRLNKNNKKYKEMEENQCKVHSWVIINDNTVCKECGKISGRDAFMQKKAINHYLLDKQKEEEFKIYQDKAIEGLATKHSLTQQQIRDVGNDFMMIKTSFYIEKMDKFLQETADKKNE